MTPEYQPTDGNTGASGPRTMIEGSWVVGYDNVDETHVLYEDAEVVFAGDEIEHVGYGYDGKVDYNVAGEYLVIPGMINMNARIDALSGISRLSEKMNFEYDKKRTHNKTSPIKLEFTAGEIESIAAHSMSVMLKTGSTTIADLASPHFEQEGSNLFGPRLRAEIANQLGIRAYVSIRYPEDAADRENNDETSSNHEGTYDKKVSESVSKFVEQYQSADSDRIHTIIQASDSMSQNTLAKIKSLADNLGIPVKLDTASSRQRVDEFRDRRETTPINHLEESGILDTDLCLVHCLYPDARWNEQGIPEPLDETLDLLSQLGVTVIHCPTAHRGHGELLNSISRYTNHDINVALGTDVGSPNLSEGMRWGAMVEKWIESDQAAGSARELFNSVTLSAAKALRRDDIGRLEPGAKADIVALNLSSGHTTPINDPIKTLVHYVTPKDVEHVFVDGEQTVKNGSLTMIDEQSVASGMKAVQNKIASISGEEANQDTWNSEQSLPTFPVRRNFDLNL